MKCQVCIHPKKLDIEREVVQGGNLSFIAKKYDVSNQSIGYHRDNHVSRQMVQAYQKKELNHSINLLERIDRIVARAEKIFRRNYEAKKDGMALKALSEQRQTFELLAKISYALHQAKLMEQGQHREEQDEEDALFAEQQMEILTLEELQVFARIQEKISMQDSEIDCLSGLVRERESIPIEGDNENSLNKRRMRRTRYPEGKDITEPEKPVTTGETARKQEESYPEPEAVTPKPVKTYDSDRARHGILPNVQFSPFFNPRKPY